MTESIFQEPDQKGLSEYVISSIEQALLDGDLGPGNRLIEAHIAAQMGISRGPVREAFRRLEERGLLTVAPRKGVRVATITEDDAREIQSLRSVLEALAIRLAIPRLRPRDISRLQSLVDNMEKAARAHDIARLVQYDLEFHGLLAEKSGHRRLHAILSDMNLQIRNFMIVRKLLATSELKEIAMEHQSILDAIRNQDADLASKLIQDHIQQTGTRLIDGIRQMQEKKEI